MTFNFYLISTYVLAILLFLGTPGPVTILVINSSTKGGIRAGLFTIIGTNLASLILMACSFSIIKGLFAVNASLLSWIAIVGSLYLLYFAYTIIFSSFSLNTDSTNRLGKNYFTNGFLIGISNPKDILFFIAFFPAFLGVSSDFMVSVVVLVTIWMILDYSILFAYTVLFSKYITVKLGTIINRVSGVLLFLIALYSLYVHVLDIAS